MPPEVTKGVLQLEQKCLGNEAAKLAWYISLNI